MKTVSTTWYFIYLTPPTWEYVKREVKGGIFGLLWGMDVFMFKIPLIKTYFLSKYLLEVT